MEITKDQNNAVNDIIEMIVSVMGSGSREIDTTEAISSTARLAGSFLYRSFGFKIEDAKPGTAMLSHDANNKGPELVNITHAVLQSFGVQIDSNKMSNANISKSNNDFTAIIGKIQTPALKIMQKNKLSYEQMAQSAAIATAFIIQQSSNITPEEGFGTAIYHYIEGSKTYPPEFEESSEGKKTADKIMNDESKIASEPKSWWKFW